MRSETMAKMVLLSSFFSVLLVLGILYIFRAPLSQYVAPIHTVQVPEVQPSTEQQLISAIEAVNPAVVSVIVTKDVPVYERYYESVNPWGAFGGFQVPRIRENGTERQEVGGGSGFVVSNDGLIVTNRHVVSDTEAEYTVLFNNGVAYEVEVVALDPLFDVAILKISTPLDAAIPFLQFGDSEELSLGQTVIAIGNALGEFRNSVSVGVVSGLSRSVVASDNMGQSELLDHVIQTDAAINPGNSGGPLLNLKGEVVGVNVAVSSGAENIGFSLPGNVVSGVVDSVQEHGRIIRPFLGVQYVMLNEMLADSFDVPVSYGALIRSDARFGDRAIAADSPAEAVGLAAGMIILEVDGVSLQDRDLASVLRSKMVGDEVDLLVWVDGEEQVFTVLLDQAL